jgi:hypothetical protein
MDRYIGVKKIMGVMLNKYEQTSVELACASDIESFARAKVGLETIRELIGNIVELLPESKQEEFMKRFYDYYKTSAVKATLPILGNATVEGSTETTKTEE